MSKFNIETVYSYGSKGACIAHHASISLEGYGELGGKTIAESAVNELKLLGFEGAALGIESMKAQLAWYKARLNRGHIAIHSTKAADGTMHVTLEWLTKRERKVETTKVKTKKDRAPKGKCAKAAAEEAAIEAKIAAATVVLAKPKAKKPLGTKSMGEVMNAPFNGDK